MRISLFIGKLWRYHLPMLTSCAAIAPHSRGVAPLGSRNSV